MIVGENARSDEMNVNPRRKRSSPTCAPRAATTPSGRAAHIFSLEQALEFIADDEAVEVTPQSVRLRKAVLDVRGAPPPP